VPPKVPLVPVKMPSVPMQIPLVPKQIPLVPRKIPPVPMMLLLLNVVPGLLFRPALVRCRLQLAVQVAVPARLSATVVSTTTVRCQWKLRVPGHVPHVVSPTAATEALSSRLREACEH
jgi:hypothetical protein